MFEFAFYPEGNKRSMKGFMYDLICDLETSLGLLCEEWSGGGEERLDRGKVMVIIAVLGGREQNSARRQHSCTCSLWEDSCDLGVVTDLL